LLVDDGCTDNTIEIARGRLPAEGLTVLRGSGQLWWSGSLQLAYEHLLSGHLKDDDAILIINDDVTFAPDFLARGIDALRERPGACIQAMGIGRTCGTVDRGAIADLTRLRFRAAEPGETPNCLSTRGLLMGAKTFKRSGGFRPRWLPHYLSDYEFTIRLHRGGTPLVVDERFVAEVDFAKTGLSRPSSAGVRQVWCDSFSNRAKFNPKHWTALAVLVCPRWIMPWRVLRIWTGFARSLLVAARSEIRHASTP
jgi:hypothetical protein